MAKQTDIKWIKIATNIFDDEKICYLETLPDGDTILIIWIKLLALAGRCNDCGLIYITRDIPYDPELLAGKFRRPLNTVKLALHEFLRLKMIEIDHNLIAITNWDKHQSEDQLEIIKEKNRLRQEHFRARRKLSLIEGPKRDSNVTDNEEITPGNAPDIEEEGDIERDIYILVSHWNSKLIIKHDEDLAVKKFQKRHKDIIRVNGIEECKKAIDNYAEVISSPEKYFFTYKWSLWDFIARGLDKFLPAADPLRNFLKKKEARPFRAINPAWESLPDEIKAQYQRNAAQEIGHDD